MRLSTMLLAAVATAWAGTAAAAGDVKVTVMTVQAHRDGDKSMDPAIDERLRAKLPLMGPYQRFSSGATTVETVSWGAPVRARFPGGQLEVVAKPGVAEGRIGLSLKERLDGTDAPCLTLDVELDERRLQPVSCVKGAEPTMLLFVTAERVQAP